MLPNVITVIDEHGRRLGQFDRYPKKAPARTGKKKDDERPPVDWTGCQYKARSELTVNYDHRGRECMHGPADTRTEPLLSGVNVRAHR